MILWRPKAVEAIIELADYVGNRNPAAADRFLTAVEATFHQLEEMPGIGHLHDSDDPHTVGIRAWSVKGFRNYLIFYREVTGGIVDSIARHGQRYRLSSGVYPIWLRL